MLTDLDALDLYGVPNLPADRFIRVLIANDVRRSSRDFMVLCRTKRLPVPRVLSGMPVAPPDRSLADFLLRHDDDREALAVAAAAVQRKTCSVEGLAFEAEGGPARGRPRLVRVINALSVGIRSLPENDFRELVRRSRVLPEPLWNCLVRLPNGSVLSPDALFEDAGVVHETNGRRYHAAEDLFEDMQRRHDVMVAAGLIPLHNSPRRLDREGREVIKEVEACYLRHQGRGLPPGVEIIRRGAA